MAIIYRSNFYLNLISMEKEKLSRKIEFAGDIFRNFSVVIYCSSNDRKNRRKRHTLRMAYSSFPCDQVDNVNNFNIISNKYILHD